MLTPSIVGLLQMLYRTTELFLCQAAFFDNNALLDVSFHVDLLCSGLAAAKAMLDFYLSLPVYAEMTFNNSEWIQLGFAVTVAARLTVASCHRAIDPQTRHLRQSLDLANVLRQIYLRVGALATPQVDANGNRDMFYHYGQRVRRIQSWCEHFSATATSLQLDPQLATCAPNHSGAPITPSHTMASIPTINVSESTESSQPFHHPPNGPGVWTDMSSSGSVDIQISDLFPELDPSFWDWSSPLMP